MLEGDLLQLGQFADDGWYVGEPVGADHEGLEVFQLPDLLGEGVQPVAEEVERLGIGILLDLLDELVGVAIADADFLFALGVGLVDSEEHRREKCQKQESGRFHGS